MKKTLKTLGKALPVFAVVALLLAGCADAFNINIADGKGVLSVSISGDERTLVPVDFTGVTYSITITRDFGTIIEDEAFTGSADFELEPGSGYRLYVSASKDDVLIAESGSREFSITGGQVNSLKLVLTPYQRNDVHGTFSFDISLPLNEDGDIADFITSAAIQLTPDINTVASAELLKFDLFDDKEGSMLLPPGRYTMRLDVETARAIHGTANLGVARVMVVYIYSGLVTPLVLALTEDDFTADVILRGTASVVDNFSGLVSGDYIPSRIWITDEYGIPVEGLEAGWAFTEYDLFDDFDDPELVTGIGYQWRIRLPSHFRNDLNLARMFFTFNAVHKADLEETNPRTILGRIYQRNLTDIHGVDAGNLEMRIQEIVFDPTRLPTGATVSFNNMFAVGVFNALNVERLSGYMEFTVTNPTNWGLVARGFAISNSNNPDASVNALSADWTDDGLRNHTVAQIIENGNGTNTIRMRTQQVLSYEDVALRSRFFRLTGEIEVTPPSGHESLIGADYKPSSVRLLDPHNDDAFIATATVTGTGAGDDPFTWTANIPAGYVWYNTSYDYKKEITANSSTPAGVPSWTEVAYGNFVSITGISSANITPWPGTVTNVTAYKPFNSNLIEISWDGVDWARSYRVYRVGVDTPIATVAGAENTTLDWTITEAISTAQFYVQAQLGGNFFTNDTIQLPPILPSNSVSFLPIINPPAAPIIGTPTVSTVDGWLDVTLNWNVASNVDNYIVERSVDGINWTVIATLGQVGTHVDTQLVNCYVRYRVKARNLAGDGPYATFFQTYLAPYVFIEGFNDSNLLGVYTNAGSTTDLSAGDAIIITGNDIDRELTFNHISGTVNFHVYGSSGNLIDTYNSHVGTTTVDTASGPVIILITGPSDGRGYIQIN